MSIENSRSSSIDGQWIRDNEAKEFKYEYSRSDDEKTEYQKIVERLALYKIRNELMFKGMLDAKLRSFERDGITITREQLIQDIDKEVINQRANQRLGFDLDGDLELYTEKLSELDDELDKNLESVSLQTQEQIDSLKNDLNNIFESDSVQDKKPISAPEEISREPITSTQENAIQHTVHTEEEKQEIREQMRQAQEQLAQTLEWAKQQPNEPQFTSTRSDNIEETPEWTKDRGVSGYTEPTLEQVRQGLESQNQQVQQEQKDKDLLINGIIGRMIDAGEFSYIPVENISERIDAMNITKKRLQEKRYEELEIIFDSYVDKVEKTESIERVNKL